MALSGRIVDALAVTDNDSVLEIGPGRGVLTTELIDRAGAVTAIEIDRDLAAELVRRFDESQLTLIQQDILGVDLGRCVELPDGNPPREWVVAGNLPYNLSKPIAMKLIRERAAVKRAVLMFQREVAQRITAKPGTRDYGPLTVLAGRRVRGSHVVRPVPRGISSPSTGDLNRHSLEPSAASRADGR